MLIVKLNFFKVKILFDLFILEDKLRYKHLAYPNQIEVIPDHSNVLGVVNINKWEIIHMYISMTCSFNKMI